MADVLRSDLLQRHGFVHGFSLRTGGVSEEPYASLNLGRTVGDTPRAVAENMVRFARSVGFDPGPVMEGSRETSDGSVVRWRLTDPEAARDGGALPFLIDWGRSPHPAESLDHACRLGELRLRHPEPDRIRPFLDTLRPRVVLHPGPEPAISAHLDTPVGRVVLG
ncbi:MAG: laccase domain-containing protein [Gemmatimonadota bacterium]